MGFSKLHSSLVNSSLWTQPDSTRILFITMLALCDRSGVVCGSREGISRIANISPDDNDEAWSSLMSPDPDSSDRLRNPENEGRRVEEVAGGFRLLNYSYYRGLRNEDDRREQNRQAQERFQQRQKAKISHDKPDSATVSPDNPMQRQSAEAEAEPEKKEKKGRERPRPSGLSEVVSWVQEKHPDWLADGLIDPEAFYAWHENHRWRLSDGQKMSDWRLAAVTWVKRNREKGPK